jgi:hypothetical protein
VAAYTATGGGTLAAAGGTVAVAGALLLVGAVVLRLAPLVPWAVGLGGVGYVVGREQHHVVDGWAALVGAALLLAAELAAWSIAHDRRIREERPVVLRQAAVLAGLVAAAALVSFVLVGAAAVSTPAGLALTAVGVASAVAAVSGGLRLLRGWERSLSSPSRRPCTCPPATGRRCTRAGSTTRRRWRSDRTGGCT